VGSNANEKNVTSTLPRGFPDVVQRAGTRYAPVLAPPIGGTERDLQVVDRVVHSIAGALRITGMPSYRDEGGITAKVARLFQTRAARSGAGSTFMNDTDQDWLEAVAMIIIMSVLQALDPSQFRVYPTQYGYDAMETVSLSNALFSKVQQRVLALIFGHPERSFYTSEIVRSVHSGTGAVERELSRLQSSGLVSVERIGNQKHYRANPKSPIFEELQSLVVKTVGLSEPIRKTLEPYSDKITTAFVYGSVAKGTDTARSDIDLMVIGDELDYSELYAALQNAETQLRRKVNPTFLSSIDWRRKVAQKGSFVSKVGGLPKIFIFGSESDLKT
jgi:predicted nucleotidyltransferase